MTFKSLSSGLICSIAIGDKYSCHHLNILLLFRERLRLARSWRVCLQPPLTPRLIFHPTDPLSTEPCSAPRAKAPNTLWLLTDDIALYTVGAQ